MFTRLHVSIMRDDINRVLLYVANLNEEGYILLIFMIVFMYHFLYHTSIVYMCNVHVCITLNSCPWYMSVDWTSSHYPRPWAEGTVLFVCVCVNTKFVL